MLEDVNEHPFRVERMLLQLEYAGILNRQSAIVSAALAARRPTSMTPAILWRASTRFYVPVCPFR